MIQIQKDILEIGLDTFVEKYDLNYVDAGHKFLLKYSTLEEVQEHKSNISVRQARGIIMDNNLNILSLPFVRFFNYGEPCADELSGDLTFFKKEDGSVIGLYYDPYDNGWCIQTSGNPVGNNQVDIFNLTFKELFYKTVNIFHDQLNKDYVYVFELCALENKVVEHHSKPYVSLLAVRDRTKINDGKYGELHFSKVKEISKKISDNLKIPDVYEFGSFEEALSSLSSLNKTREGYVVCGSGFKRIKIKNPEYVMLHHMKSGLSQDNLIKIIIEGEKDEVISYFPEYSDLLNKIDFNYEQLCEEVYHCFIDITENFTPKNRKEVAFYLRENYKHISLFHNIIFHNLESDNINIKKLMSKERISKLKKYLLK